MAESLHISRTTIYRWFGPRDGLIGEVLAHELRAAMIESHRLARGKGAKRIEETILAICSYMARSEPMSQYLRSDQLNGLRTITSTNGKVHPVAVRELEELITRVADRDDYRPSLPPDLLAFALVRMAEAFLYTQYDDAVELNTDLSRLRTVIAELLRD